MPLDRRPRWVWVRYPFGARYTSMRKGLRVGRGDSGCHGVGDVLEEVLDCWERQVGRVAKDSVAGLRQANQSSGGGRKLAGEILDDRYRADRIVFPRQDENRAFDFRQHAPRVETGRFGPEVGQVDLGGMNRSGHPLPGLLYGAGLAAIQPVAGPIELFRRLFGE